MLKKTVTETISDHLQKLLKFSNLTVGNWLISLEMQYIH